MCLSREVGFDPLTLQTAEKFVANIPIILLLKRAGKST